MGILIDVTLDLIIYSYTYTRVCTNNHGNKLLYATLMYNHMFPFDVTILSIAQTQTRYPNLHFHRVRPSSVQHLYTTDEFSPSPALRPGSVRVKKTSGIAGGQLPSLSEASVSEKNETEPVSPIEDNKENMPSPTGSREVPIYTVHVYYRLTCTEI